MKKSSLIILILLLSFCCESTSDNAVGSVIVNFKFTHTWDGIPLDDSSLDNLTLTNENGEQLTITRLRYLVSRLELVTETGRTEQFNTYKFTDLSQPTTYNLNPVDNIILGGTYKLGFVWGFNKEDNIDGEYNDLNVVNWAWPAMLGGGYHFLQMDGSYIDNMGNSSPFNFHNGKARLSSEPLVVEPNFAIIALDTPITLSKNSTIEVVMNVAEFFKNPNTWNLNDMDVSLMSNYNAQKLMQENVQSVFSLGEITDL